MDKTQKWVANVYRRENTFFLYSGSIVYHLLKSQCPVMTIER